MGARLAEDVVARTNMERCTTAKETADAIVKVFGSLDRTMLPSMTIVKEQISDPTSS